ncbi:MAG: carboxypeptidase-like regulatory domain-containing protein, partial [Armatimonadetes bacterium]|nr:carboxypeptidase-like regulatory domain-containing protein [Armatimonadota bacterium]
THSCYSGLPLAGAKLYVASGFLGTSAFDGTYSISLPGGNYNLTAERADFVTKPIMGVGVIALENTPLDVQLMPVAGPPLMTVGTSNKAVMDALMQTAATKFTWVLWGKVTVIDASHFTIDDGSGVTIKVVAPGVAVTNNNYVSVKGTLDLSTMPPTLTSQQVTVHK